MANVEKDALTGTETTGHEWDGIRELNTPLPKWWVYIFAASVVWAIGYYIFMPAWPTLHDYTKGILDYSSRAAHRAEMARVAEARSVWADRFREATVDEIAGNDELRRYAMAGGAYLFADNCVPCHGAGGQGGPGYPVLADDDWLWGGTREAIEFSIRHGIRSESDETRYNVMPVFGDDYLEDEQIAQAADYVLHLSGQGGSDAGHELFVDECSVCHGEQGTGLAEMGGPNLTDGIWLYGTGSRDDVMAQIRNPKHGVMPAWEGRLDDVAIKQLAVFVHGLGGGQ